MRTTSKQRLLLLCSVAVVTIVSLFFSSSTTGFSRELATEPRVSYGLAYEQSLGFFDDIEDSSWLLLQNRARSQAIFQNPSEPDAGIQNTALWMMDNVDPIFTCPHDRRIGGLGDGPKWTCDPHRLAEKDDCLIYSVGSQGNYMFEDALFDLLGKHCEIHVFDPEPSYVREGDTFKKNIHYHPWGVKSSYIESNSPPEFRSLPEIMQALGHVGRRIDVFKVDCEGCEFTSYKDWISSRIDIRQILVETHPPFGFNAQISIGGFFKDLVDHGFLPFSKEANTNPTAEPLGTLFEWGFVKLDTSFLGSAQAKS